MAKKLETTFKEKVYEELKKIPNLVAFKIQQLTIRGTPDFLICANGMFIALELKSGSKKPDALQEYNLQRVNKAKGLGLAMSPSNYEKTMEVIKILSLGGKYDRNNMGPT